MGHVSHRHCYHDSSLANETKTPQSDTWPCFSLHLIPLYTTYLFAKPPFNLLVIKIFHSSHPTKHGCCLYAFLCFSIYDGINRGDGFQQICCSYDYKTAIIFFTKKTAATHKKLHMMFSRSFDKLFASIV